MTPSELKSHRKKLRLSAEAFARLVGAATGRTVRRWEHDKNNIPGAVARLLQVLELLSVKDRYAFVDKHSAKPPDAPEDESDDEIDTSDIPEADEAFFQNARLRQPR